MRWRTTPCWSPALLVKASGLSGSDDVGIGGLGEVGEEDMMPGGHAGAGADILHIEDVVLEVFVEDAGLDLEGCLRGFELVLQLEQIAGALGSEVESVDEADGEGGEGEDGDDADEAEGSDAAGAHGGDFGVGGEAAEAKQDAGEDGGGDGDGEGVGEHVADDAHGVGERGAVDQEVDDLVDVVHEEHEGEEDSAEEGVGDDFAENVAGEDAHTVLSLSVARFDPIHGDEAAMNGAPDVWAVRAGLG